MTCKPRQLFLTEALRSQIRGLLKRGHSLSHAVYDEITNARMIYFFVPEEREITDVTSLQVGGMCSQDESTEALIEMLIDYLQDDSDNIVVFDAPLIKPNDEFLQVVGSKWGSHKDEVYFFLTRDDTARKTVESTLRRAMDSFYFLAILTKHVGDIPAYPFIIGTNHLRNMVNDFHTVLLGVFDGESFIQIPRQDL